MPMSFDPGMASEVIVDILQGVKLSNLQLWVRADGVADRCIGKGVKR
jgi:hypothetical protein